MFERWKDQQWTDQQWTDQHQHLCLELELQLVELELELEPELELEQHHDHVLKVEVHWAHKRMMHHVHDLCLELEQEVEECWNVQPALV